MPHVAHGQQLVPYGHPQVVPVTSGLHVTPRFFFLQWMLYLVRPVITIGPRKQPIPWNRPTVVPLPPGNYEVKVHYPWLGEGNPAKMVVPVHPGYCTELSYDTRFLTFMAGDMRQRGFRVWGT